MLIKHSLDAKIFKAHLPNGKGSRQSCTFKPLTETMALSKQIARAFCPKGQSEVTFSSSPVSYRWYWSLKNLYAEIVEIVLSSDRNKAYFSFSSSYFIRQTQHCNSRCSPHTCMSAEHRVCQITHHCHWNYRNASMRMHSWEHTLRKRTHPLINLRRNLGKSINNDTWKKVKKAIRLNVIKLSSKWNLPTDF